LVRYASTRFSNLLRSFCNWSGCSRQGTHTSLYRVEFTKFVKMGFDSPDGLLLAVHLVRCFLFLQLLRLGVPLLRFFKVASVTYDLLQAELYEYWAVLKFLSQLVGFLPYAKFRERFYRPTVLHYVVLLMVIPACRIPPWSLLCCSHHAQGVHFEATTAGFC